MSRVLDALSWLVTVRPIATLLVLLAITIVLGAGMTQRAPQAESTVFLPDDSRVAAGAGKIEMLFGSASGRVTATLIFRGNALTPDGLAQIDRTLHDAVSDPRIEPRLALPNAVASPTLLLAAVLGSGDFAALSQGQIDEAASDLPLDRLVGVDQDGDPVAVAYIQLLQDSDGDGDVADDADAVAAAERAIREIAVASGGPLDGGSLSPATIAEDATRGAGSDMTTLMLLALAVIAALLLLFTRSFFDLVLALLGLVLTVIWITGAQGWLGPNGLDVIGRPNTLTTMVPIMLIGLVVDYAIQTFGLFREQRAEGHPAATAVRRGLRAVIIPLSLAAITTIVSFLTNVTSPIPANADFGIVAGLGVAFGLIVMLSLLASARVLRDRRRESRGSLPPARPAARAIPGVGLLGSQLARRPAPFLVVVGVVTVVLGASATQIDTVFDARDFLPTAGDATRDLETLDAAFGGSTDPVKVLIEAEVTDDRTVRNLIDFSSAFSDDLRRPEGVVGGLQSSLGTLLVDWITDDGAPGDNFDPELLAMTLAADQFRLAPAQIQAIIDRLEDNDPEGFAAVAIDDPNGVDTLLVQFEALTGDQERTARMVDDVRGLWFGDEREITAISDEVIGLEVVGTMTDSQTDSIILTVLAALVILVIFFWITERRAALGFIAVAPIVLVLVWVLGTMALLGIPYNVVTALITALSIGIGVDYTIHIIHRYEGEFAQLRDPEAAARRTLATTGAALLGSALTTALGFGVLILSSVTPIQQFGIVTAITIAYALVAAVVVVPPMMIVWAAYQNHRLRTAAARAAREFSGES